MQIRQLLWYVQQLVMITGNPGVFPWYPYPPQQVWVLMGKGKGLEGLVGFDTLDGFVVFIKGIGTHASQWMMSLMYCLNLYIYSSSKNRPNVWTLCINVLIS